MSSSSVDAKLGLLTYKKAPEPHISITDSDVCLTRCHDKPCTKVCPASVYSWNEEQKKIHVQYENCIECGACRMVCPFQNIRCEWPGGGLGVQYKYG